MQVRGITDHDIPVLADLYRDAARGLGSQAYSAAQIEIWASFPDDFAAFRDRLQRGLSVVSIDAECVAAFGQLDPDDHVSLLYTGTRFARRGHASAIYQHLEAAARERGISRLTTTASRLSRPFFAKHGFDLIEVELYVYKGVEFERFKMAKTFCHSR